MPGDFDLVKERIDIVALIGERVALKKAGRAYKGLCPFHTERTPSFQVDPDRRTYKCFGCLPPGTLIKTANGPRSIESIQVGDEVFALDGQLHRVVQTHEHLFAGELVRLIAAPFKIPLLLTPDHKVPVFRPKSRRFEHVEAGLLRPQNHLIYPLVDREGGLIDWQELPLWRRRFGPAPKSLPTSVDVALFAEWLGWYLAEGSVSNDRTVRFSLAQDEMHVAERLVDLSDALFGERPRIDARPKGTELWFCHALLARWLKHHCGDGALKKKLPSFVFSWTRSQQDLLIDALVSGDGSISKGGYVGYGPRPFVAKPSWELTLASPRLIDDIRDLLLRQGRVPRMRDDHQDDGRCSWTVGLSEQGQSDWVRGDGPEALLPVRIRRIDRIPYDGAVFNLTVAEHHTFVTMTAAVANCGEGGDAFTWLEKMDHLEPVEALNVLAERAGVELTRRKPEEREHETRLLKVNETAQFYFRQALRGTEKGKAAAAYLAKRGISAETVDAFGLGYAPDIFNGLMGYLQKKSFTPEEGLAAGVLTQTDRGIFDRFRDRLMVTIRDPRGRAVAFGGRAMRADQPAKYVNTTNTLLFNKSDTLYAFDVARAPIRGAGSAVIVEGYFDAIACHQAGITNVVASMGTALTPEQYLRLQDMKIERVVVAFDGDAAGQRSAETRGRDLLPLLQRHRAGQVSTRGYATLYVTVLPQGLDPDDLARTEPDRLRALIGGAASLLDFLIDRVRARSELGRSEGRLRFLDEVASILAWEPDQIRREVYLSRVASDTGIDPAALRDRVSTAERAPARAVQPLRAPQRDAPAPNDGRSVKQTLTQERYVMALLTRFPEEIRRVDLEPADLADPDLRALLIELQAGKRPSTDLPAHLAAIAAALSATAQELGDEADPGQAIEIAAQRQRVQRLRDRLGEARAKLARASDTDVTELAAEVEQLAAEFSAAMARLERRTVLRGDTERRESE